ncbi:hypothetical protein [Streptomyces sp. NPDC006459]|uniref:hypothetical protein n=1 Tax=Streptomyces sp. NPDC006459 TaxID=3154303 RepID=UPI0033AF568B
MTDEVGRKRHDRARAFVPELIPEPVDLERSGPLDARELRDLERVHDARDHHGTAQWMRGKALEAAFRRRLYRGEGGERTRQEYLDAEWDGMSESAAYLEIREWRLAHQIAEAYGRPVADSHVRALVDAADHHGHSPVAAAYVELRKYGSTTGRRVTGAVVENLARYLSDRGLPSTAPKELSGEVNQTSEDLDDLFSPQLPGPRNNKARATGDAERPWKLSAGQVRRLSTWITAEAEQHGKPPTEVAELLLGKLEDPSASWRPWA